MRQHLITIKIIDDETGSELWTDEVDMSAVLAFKGEGSLFKSDLEAELVEEVVVVDEGDKNTEVKRSENLDDDETQVSPDQNEDDTVEPDHAAEGEEEETKYEDVIEEELEEIDYAIYVESFAEWAANQHIKSGFFCQFEIDRTSPYPERKEDLWAIWANHDCSNWEVLFTYVMTQETWGRVLASTGFMYSDMDCQEIQSGETVLE